MKIRMDYGKTGVVVDFPDDNLKAILDIKQAVVLSSPLEALGMALQNPIGTESLSDLAIGKQSVCIVICDITRPVPNELLLKPILRTLELAGI